MLLITISQNEISEKINYETKRATKEVRTVQGSGTSERLKRVARTTIHSLNLTEHI